MEIEPPQPPAHRLPLTCDRHPNDNFTGFCPSCLRERLQTLEYSASTATTHRNSTSTISSSLKSIFFRPPNSTSAASSSSLHQPGLRRCKSFSFAGGGGGPRLSTSFEPQRKSCDVRGRNTLWSLFNQDGPPPFFVDDDDNGNGNNEINENDGDDIRAAAAVVETSGEVKPMKDHIDLEPSHANYNGSSNKKQISSSSFWIAASVFSKKLQKWRRKQKMKKLKKHGGGEGDSKPDPKSSSGRRFHETQSEIAVDAFGRRSCDFAPRFSLDAGRISFDDPRYSFDEPRASWDGYLIGSRALHPRLPPMLSVVEDVPPTPVVHRSDGQIPVEEDLTVPGGSQQTKDYYSDSSSRSRRRSLDRSNSVKKLSVEMNEPPIVHNSSEFLREWSSNSLRDDRSESFESAYREDPNHKLPPRKKSKRWSKAWSIWGFIHRRNSSRGGENVVDRSFSEIWPNGYANGRILRSNSNVSWRSSIHGNAGFGSSRKNGLEGNGFGKKKKKKKSDESVLDRNRSARFSPGHVDNGMLRFYLTPMKGSRRGSGIGNNNSNNNNNNSYHSFARSMLRLY